MPFTLSPAVVAANTPPDGKPAPPRIPLPVGDISTRRERINALFARMKAAAPVFPDIHTQDFSTKAPDGHEVLLRWYTKQDEKSRGSAIFYVHGGGMYAGSVEQYDNIIKSGVDTYGVPFFAPEYRVGPESRAPTLVQDCYAGLQYLVEHAAELGVDPGRIAVMGDSAGGGVAAALVHYIKQQNGPFVKQQILIYPMLDDRTATVNEHGKPALSWSVDDNKTGWGAILGDRLGGPDVKPFDASGRATLEDCVGLPPTYMDVGQHDLFAGECLAYAGLLNQAGVEVEFHFVPGMPHAWDQFLPKNDETLQRTLAHRIALIHSL